MTDKKPLSEKRTDCQTISEDYKRALEGSNTATYIFTANSKFIHESFVKEKIQNAQRRVKEEFDYFKKMLMEDRDYDVFKARLDKIFKEEFGDKIISNKSQPGVLGSAETSEDNKYDRRQEEKTI